MHKDNSFRNYLKRSFTNYAVALILLMLVLFIVFMVGNVLFTTIHANNKSNRLLHARLNDQYSAYANGISEMAQGELLSQVLANPSSKEVTTTNELLYGFANAQLLPSTFVLLDAGGQVVSSNLYQGNRVMFCNAPSVQGVVDRLAADPQRLYSGVSRLNYSDGQECDLLFAHAVTKGERVLGYLFFDIQDAGLDAYIRSLRLDLAIVADRFDNVIFSTVKPIADPMGKFPVGKYRLDRRGDNTAMVDGKLYHVIASVLPNSGIQIFTLFSVEMQVQMFIYGIISLLFIGIGLLVLVSVLSERAIQRNLRSIDELVYAVSQGGHGNINYRIESKNFDEFQTLYNEFNRMMDRLQELLYHNEELAERRRIMEVKHLEEQFNPHFVFNILETLRYEILIDPKQASEMVVSFATLMRYSIHYGATKVSLETDIQYVNDYLLLQKMRYNKRLEYYIDLPEELLICMVPKLALQPMVENSLVHGMDKKRLMSVHITGRKTEDGSLELSVSDNGCGIQPEKLAQLQALLEDENAGPARIGLYNVHRAVRLLYGNNYGVTIESQSGEGTCVTLRIPMETEDTDV